MSTFPQTDSVPWDPAYSEDWARQVAQWPWEEWQAGTGPIEGWKKVGNCPNCGHRIAVYQEIVFTFDESKAEFVDVGCNCRRPHAGRPEDDKWKGCGKSAEIRAMGSQ
jgi:hypothetical protein